MAKTTWQDAKQRVRARRNGFDARGIYGYDENDVRVSFANGEELLVVLYSQGSILSAGNEERHRRVYLTTSRLITTEWTWDSKGKGIPPIVIHVREAALEHVALLMATEHELRIRMRESIGSWVDEWAARTANELAGSMSKDEAQAAARKAVLKRVLVDTDIDRLKTPRDLTFEIEALAAAHPQLAVPKVTN
jgi:hypothetical protein